MMADGNLNRDWLIQDVKAIRTFLMNNNVLIILIIGCIPLTVPRAMGYQLYTVITGSMEPNVPVGSLVFVKNVDPAEIQEKNVSLWVVAHSM